MELLVRLRRQDRTFCIYDATASEAICETAARNELPVGQITRVSVLDLYF